MAASVRSSATTLKTFNSTSHAINYPGDIVAGDIIFAAVGGPWDGIPSLTDSGWVTLGYATRGGSKRQSFILGYKIADGTETGTFTWQTTVAHNITAICVSVEGSLVPVMGNILLSTGTTPNSPSFSPVDGVADYLWAAISTWTNNVALTGWPANMTTGPQLNIWGPTSGYTPTAMDFQAENTDTFDPGNFSLGASIFWMAVTAAFPPSAPAAGGGPTGLLRKSLGGVLMPPLTPVLYPRN